MSVLWSASQRRCPVRIVAFTIVLGLALLLDMSIARADSTTPTGFGFAHVGVNVTPKPGASESQAGSHPAELTVGLELNDEEPSGILVPEGGEARDIAVTLPPGLVGNPKGVPQCPQSLLDTPFEAKCPLDTQVGIVKVELGSNNGERAVFETHLFNMAPPPGVPAEFAFAINGVSAILDAQVGSPAERYALKVNIHNITQRQLISATTTLWGVPAEHVTGGSATPLLTLPTSCGQPLIWSVKADTWTEPGSWATGEAQTPAVTGCEHNGFAPTLNVLPEEARADTPTGLNAELSVPPEGLVVPTGLASTNIKSTTATLPAGMVVNPGQAMGLEFCSSEKAAIEEPEAPPSCPPGSKIGTAEIQTPVLSEVLTGGIYLLPSDPPNLEVAVTASGAGVNLKLIGKAHLDPVTGQITASFSETPDLPVGTLKLHFPGGATSVVDTPASCGSYAVNADLTPWASPFVADVFDGSSFNIGAGPGGSACSSPLPFAPTLLAGANSIGAGQFTSFALQLQRADGQQRISALQTTMPPGLAGVIGSVPLCEEPAASKGECSAASQIGHAVAVAGPGANPLTIPQPGQPPVPVYLTGPYGGAPFGLSIVTPIIAGPFNLGTVVVRARINIDPHTAQVTVTTDPTGPYAIPRIIDGVPVDLRSVAVTIDRPGFLFNPTGCTPATIAATASSTEGTAVGVSSPYQITGCKELPFKPAFSVSTSGKTSKKYGASIDAKVVFPSGSFGGSRASNESDIKAVKVNLPEALPSRLSTLQKACVAATFEANPAACPSASEIGIARAITPVLPVPLTGPVYFVSHGGAQFPDLDIVLQGDGVRVNLTAATVIHKGITSSIFRFIPDVPVSSFELYLPEGPYSALAAYGDLCKKSLAMPTEFTAQSGAVIHETTKIAVTGCPRVKATKAKSIKKNTKAKKAAAFRAASSSTNGRSSR
jgi:hypothetical protein